MYTLYQMHNLQVKGLAFNTHTPNLLASGGGDGELCIWDVANPSSPSLYPAMKVHISFVEGHSIHWVFISTECVKDA